VVNNAAKYSHASKLKISLNKINQQIDLHITDNGKGFDETTVKAGNGLRNLKERATEVGGVLSIKSELGKGTTVALKLPIA
jgi:signal transduction histidine kinase